MARPVTFTREKTKQLAEEMLEYFDVEPTTIVDGKEKVNDLPLIQDFCKSHGISKDTLYRLVKKEEHVQNEAGIDVKRLVHPELSDSLKRAKDMQESIWIKNALKGNYNSTFAIFTGKNMFGWRDKTETDLTSDGEPLKILWQQSKSHTPQENGQ